MNIEPKRIVYIGDNLNDLKAAEVNGTHFIGFSTDTNRRRTLARAGAVHVTSTHSDNLALIGSLLGLNLTKGIGDVG